MYDDTDEVGIAWAELDDGTDMFDYFTVGNAIAPKAAQQHPRPDSNGEHHMMRSV